MDYGAVMTNWYNKPSAFVIMPLDEALKPVYELLIRPILEEEGFDVERADDIESQQNILKDILNKIRSSDLIVADLTDLNPNVFYELGIAHAFRRNVLLLTQTIEEVPFDLRPYRLLEYNTHFARIEDAREKLKSYAQGCRGGSIDFGSPVTDFVTTDDLPLPPSTTNSADVRSISSEHFAEEGTEEEEEAPGYLDHQIALQEGNERIFGILNAFTTNLQTLTQYIEDATVEVNTIGSNPTTSSARAARSVFRRLAGRISHFSSKLGKANTEYGDILEETEDSLEQIVAFLLENPYTSESELDDFNKQLESIEQPAAEAKTGCLSFADSMASLPKIERRLNRAVAFGSEELRVMATNIDRTAASIGRARQRINYQAK